MGRRDEYDDERVVVVEQGGSSGLGMLLLGLAVGAGAALLFAPASGEETRERIQREARRARRRAQEFTEDVSDEIADRVDRTRATFEDRVEQARDAVRSRANAVGDAVDAGRDAAKQARAELERAVQESKRAYADSRRAFRESRNNAGGSSALTDAAHDEGEGSADDTALSD
jgi:gas vesicle protein